VTVTPTSAAQLAANRRAAILGPLAARSHCSRAEAQAAAVTLGLSERQVFALVRRLRAMGNDPAALQPVRSSGGRGKPRLPAVTEEMIQQLISDVERSMSVISTAAIIGAVQRECHARQLHPPSVATLRRRVKAANGSKASPSEPPLPKGTPFLAGVSHQAGSRPADAEAHLLASLYESVGKEDGWNQVIEAVTHAYDGGRGLIAVHDPTTHSGWAQAGSGWEAKTVAEYNTYYVSTNPWIPYLNKRPVGQVVVSDEIVPKAELPKTEFYNDVLRHYSVDTAIGLTAQRGGSRHFLVSVLFPRATLEWDVDAVSRLQRLAPHLLRIAQLNRQFAALEIRAVTAETALDRLTTAMLIVNADSEVVHLNASAERVVSAGDGLSIVRKRITAALSGEADYLRQLLGSAMTATRDIASHPGGVMRVSRKSGRRAYELLVSPIGEQTFAGSFIGTTAVVFVRDPEERSVTTTEWLKSLYHLTNAETVLMQALLAGDTLDAIVETAGVGKETLRSQLKSIFLKTGTSSQVELLRLGLRGLGMFQR
jgi:DNA-binding CsgD family transcriptional regulator